MYIRVHVVPGPLVRLKTSSIYLSICLSFHLSCNQSINQSIYIYI